jgi:hypothetical protein
MIVTPAQISSGESSNRNAPTFYYSYDYTPNSKLLQATPATTLGWLIHNPVWLLGQPNHHHPDADQ